MLISFALFCMFFAKSFGEWHEQHPCKRSLYVKLLGVLAVMDTASDDSNKLVSRADSSVLAGGLWGDEQGIPVDGQLFFVSSYRCVTRMIMLSMPYRQLEFPRLVTLTLSVSHNSDFEKLAHGPRGTEAKDYPLCVYRFHSDGSLVLLNVLKHDSGTTRLANPAFSRHHPRLNVVYTCTEDIGSNGLVFAYQIGPNGELSHLGDPVDAGGTSTCYLTLDKAHRHLLCVNYWDATISVIPLEADTGRMKGPVTSRWDPKNGKPMVATGRCHGGVNHSNNDASTIRMRQADPHSHALVLDPLVGTVAYVPDLGKDLIRELFYKDGKIEAELNVLPSGLCTGLPDGPRYIEFHPKYPVAYVVNELSSTVAVFEVDRALLREMKEAANPAKFIGRSTLRLIQSIKTIPGAFPTALNTCGRICVHKSGRYVLVSNRGHQSLACFRVIVHGCRRGELVSIGHFHTRGETPRHFQFDSDGQFLLVANQDTDSIAVFKFNLSSGQISYTGNEYRCPSPNFVCCCPLYQEEEDSHEAPLVSNMNAVFDVSSLSAHGAVDTGRDSSCVETGSVCSSNSTMEVNSKIKERNLEEELKLARLEIAELKKLLSAETRDADE
jgi:6-phosphogluconolactonase